MPNIIEVLIRGDATQALSAIAQTQKAGDRLAQNLNRLGGDLSRVLTVPIAAVGTAGVAAQLEAEDALVELAKTVDAPILQLERLRDRFEQLSEDTLPKSANELTRIAALGGQLGILTQNLEKFTVTAAALDVATDLDAETAATELAQLANIMGTAQTEFDRMGSTVVDLGNNLATTESRILEMSLRIAGAGRQAGLSEGEVLGFAGALASVGLAADAGGSAISRTMAEIQKSVAEGGAALDRFADIAGTSSQQFAQLFRADPAEAIVRVIEGLRRSGEDVFRVLESVGLGERRVSDALLRAGNASDLLRESLDRGNRAWEENTALTEEAERFYERARAGLERLRNQAVNVAAELGERLEPAFQAALRAGRILLDEVVRPSIDAFGRLPQPLQTATVALLALAAAAGPASLVLGQLIQTAGSLTLIVTSLAGPAALAALTAKLVALGAILTPAGAVIGGLALLAGAFLAVRDAATEALDTVQRQTEDLAASIERASGRALASLQDELTAKLEEQNRRIERLGEQQERIAQRFGEGRQLDLARSGLRAARAFRDQLREQLRIVDEEIARRTTQPGLEVAVGVGLPPGSSRDDALTKRIQASEEALQKQIIQLRDGEEALLRYELAKLGATEAEIEHQAALFQTKQELIDQEKWAKRLDQIAQSLAERFQELRSEQLAGSDLVSQVRQADLIAVAESIQRAWDTVSRAVSDTAIDLITLTDNVGASFRRMADTIIRELSRLATQNLFDSLFRKIGRLLTIVPGAPTGALSAEAIAANVRPPQLAAGGTVGAGRMAIVGEAGPELIFGPATVVPVGQVPAGETNLYQTVQFNISALDARSMAEYVRENRHVFAGAVAQAAREGSAVRSALLRG